MEKLDFRPSLRQDRSIVKSNRGTGDQVGGYLGIIKLSIHGANPYSQQPSEVKMQSCQIIVQNSPTTMLPWRHLFKFSKEVIESSPPPEQPMIKLSKWISIKSLCSLKDAEEFIRLGLVRVDGRRIYSNLLIPEDANMRAFTDLGIRVEKPLTRLWMMNKPRGYICTHRDPQNRPNIYQILPPVFKNYGHIVSVGRLDFNSEGLLLLTNDVQLKNLLENPTANLARFYRVKVHGRVTDEKLGKMSQPILINGEQYGPLRVKVDRALSTNVWLDVELKTGKNREIRKIMQKCDLQVNKLIRESYGGYKLGSLKHGEIQQLPVSQGLQRMIKKEKAKVISKNRPALIEIDIRQEAVKLASQEQQKIAELDRKATPSQLGGPSQTKSLVKRQKKREQDSSDDVQ